MLELRRIGNEERPRIAILIAHWDVHSNVCYMAWCLGKEGYAVDVCLLNSDKSWTAGLLAQSPLISVYSFDPGVESPVENKNGEHQSRTVTASRVYSLLPARLRDWNQTVYDRFLLKVHPEFGLVSAFAVQGVAQRAASVSYAAMIGVEKGGLAWAGAVASKIPIPIIYYSLELYTRDHPWVLDSFRQRRFKVTEEKYHKQCALTLVQDEYRGRALLADNNVPCGMPVAYLPVSSFGPGRLLRSRWLHEELALPYDTTLILCYGEISKRRLSIQLTSMAQEFPDDWRLVFHGFGSPETIEKIRGMDSGGRVGLSLKFVPATHRLEVISSAKIGLAVYQKDPINDQLTGLSSEKIALYLQSGLPLVAFRYQSYEHIEREKAGILVDHIAEIPNAISTILEHYDSYQRNALVCYTKYYSFEGNFKAVAKAMHELRRRTVMVAGVKANA